MFDKHQKEINFMLRRVSLAMQLRSRKRDFTTVVTTTSDTVHANTETQTKKVAKVTTTKITSPTASTFPILTALKKRKVDDGKRVVYNYPHLVGGRLLRRYKRFLADVVLDSSEDKGTASTDRDLSVKSDQDNEEVLENEEKVAFVTVYCPNTGPMVGLLDEPNAHVQLSKSLDPKRKYAYTLEMIEIHNGERNVWVGVHSASANRMVEAALTAGWLPELGIFDSFQREVKFAKNSRVDFVLSFTDSDSKVTHQKYVEVKSVTLANSLDTNTGRRCAVFPDTISTRAQKHVTELTELIEKQSKTKPKSTDISGAIVFIVQRDDCHEFMPSCIHDQEFARLCQQAKAQGIQLLAYACTLEPCADSETGHVRLLHALPLHSSMTIADQEETHQES